jgi:hypothetical protein
VIEVFDVNRLKTFAAMLILLSMLVPGVVSYFRARDASAKAIGYLLWGISAVAAVIVIVADFAIFGNVPGTPSEFIPYAVSVVIAVVVASRAFYGAIWKLVAADLTTTLQTTGPAVGGTPNPPQRE